MLKKALLSLAGLLVIAVAAAFIFREPLLETVYAVVTKDMFVEADTDSFEPGTKGTQVGDQLPQIRVSYSGTEITSLAQFAGSRGLVVMFNRSVVW